MIGGKMVLKFKDITKTHFEPTVTLVENPYESEKTARIEITYIHEDNSVLIEFHKIKEEEDE